MSTATRGPGVTVALIPDTQILAATEPELYLGATAWLAGHAAELELAAALHLGDVVHHGAREEAEYVLAARAHATLLDAGLPLLVAPGNHDYDDMLTQSRALTMFNRYVGAAQLGDRPWFGGMLAEGCAENSYATVDGADAGLLLVVLEFGPRAEAVAWAEELLAAHRDRAGVLVTHSYLDTDGGRTRPGSPYHPDLYPASVGGADGERLWQALRRHPNLAAVFCGHQIPETVSYRVDAADDGHLVLQSFQNWQSAPRGGVGRMRIVRLDPAAATVRMSVVNPMSGEYEKDEGYQVEVCLAPSSPDAGLRYPPA